MRLAKVFLLLSLVAGSLVAATADAVRAPMDDGTLSIRDGRAAMVIRVKGSIIGRLNKGRVTVTDSPDSGATIVVRGAEKRILLSDKTTVYSGTNIRFRIADDRRFTVKLNGKGLNFSVVGRGDGWIDGWGDPSAGIFYDGSYSLNGEPYHSLPNGRTRFQLASPPVESRAVTRS